MNSKLTDADFYFSINRSESAEFKDRGSRFIAYASPIENVSDFKKELERLKKEHPKATHHCFAYRIGVDGNNFRSSDDGEPSGTAGKPILGQIDSRQLTNVLVVVVRYFGGSLLGVPGLIHAYKSATALVLQTIPVIQKPIEISVSLEFGYNLLNEVMTLVKQYNCSVIEKDLQLFCKMKLGVSKSRFEDFLFRVGEVNGLEMKRL
ncbi:MAG: YigZ family protein [Bacteroidetes bacterium]|nr:MAG: YigZ family protein [Bacteroidota bacterium]